MAKKINEIIELHDMDDKSNRYLSFITLFVLGVPFVILFVWMFFMWKNVFSLLLLIGAIVIFVLGIFSAYQSTKKRISSITNIKKDGLQFHGEVIHINKEKVGYGTDGYMRTIFLVKYVDQNGNTKYVETKVLPGICDKIKIIKEDKKQLINTGNEEMQIDFRNIDGTKKVVISNEKTESSHTISVFHNFVGTIECTIYEKDGEQLIDDFDFTDVECDGFFTK